MSRLPAGWEVATLGEVADVILGQSPPGNSYNVDGEGVAFFQGKAEFGSLYPTVQKWTTEPKKQARKDDILISVRTPVGPTNLAPLDCSIGRGLAALRVREPMPARYLLYAMRASAEALASRATGTTFPAITGSQLKAHPIAVAPLDEQQRIVEVIEEQFSRLDAGVESLQRAKRNLDRLRASVLNAAFKHKGVDWVPLRQVAHIDAKLVDPREYPSLPHIAPNHIESRTGRLMPHQTVVEDGVTSAKYLFAEGDVLYSKIRPYLAKTTVAPFRGLCSADMYPLSTKLDSRFLHFWMLSPRFTAFASQHQGRSVLPKINRDALFKLPAPSASTDCQNAVVANVESQLSTIDRVETTILQELRQASILRQTILGGAFSGGLFSPSVTRHEHSGV